MELTKNEKDALDNARKILVDIYCSNILENSKNASIIDARAKETIKAINYMLEIGTNKVCPACGVINDGCNYQCEKCGDDLVLQYVEV